MIMDQISDWLTTAWELVGLLFLAITADLIMPRRWEGDSERPSPDDATRRRRAAAGGGLRQPHLV